jgi:hypothetical protein
MPTSRSRDRLEALRNLLDAWPEREGRVTHVDVAGADATQLEQALDHVRQALALPVDHVQLGGLRRVGLVALERVDVALDNRERRPQLMRHLPDERGSSLLLVGQPAGEVLEGGDQGDAAAVTPASDRVADHAGLQRR